MRMVPTPVGRKGLDPGGAAALTTPPATVVGVTGPTIVEAVAESLAIGHSCGTAAEIAWTKSGRLSPVAVRTTNSVPPEILADKDATIMKLAEVVGWMETQLAVVKQ